MNDQNTALECDCVPPTTVTIVVLTLVPPKSTGIVTQILGELRAT